MVSRINLGGGVREINLVVSRINLGGREINLVEKKFFCWKIKLFWWKNLVVIRINLEVPKKHTLYYIQHLF